MPLRADIQGLRAVAVLLVVARCAGAHPGTWTYRDSNHLTVSGSLLLTERFARLFEAGRTGS